MFTLTPDPIESKPSEALGSAGGYVVFEGRVRDQNEGRAVLSLEYEAFDEMAVKTGNEILYEALKRFSILSATAVHRTGHLQIGDIAIRVEVGSAHRKAAFEACDWIVDETKRRVPIWKKEHYQDGDSGWINIDETPQPNRYYSRQQILPEVGEAGQRKLSEARVLVVGAGGLGSPALLYLAAAGVGTLGIAEFDTLDESNLHRQILYSAKDEGGLKSELAANRLRELNPHINVHTHNERVAKTTIDALLEDYDLVLDCTDNFRTKFLLNDACMRLCKTLIQASIYQYEGQLMVIEPGSACLRCLWPQMPAEGCVGSCAEVGVLGVVPGVFGSLQATEAIKLILGLPSPLREGKMMLFDLLSYRQQLIEIARDPECPACGTGTIAAEPAYILEASEIDVSEFVVIDVRGPDEIAAEPIASKHQIPSDRFDPSDLSPTKRYLLVCAKGERSGKLASKLWESGDRRFFSLAGGASRLKP